MWMPLWFPNLVRDVRSVPLPDLTDCHYRQAEPRSRCTEFLLPSPLWFRILAFSENGVGVTHQQGANNTQGLAFSVIERDQYILICCKFFAEDIESVKRDHATHNVVPIVIYWFGNCTEVGVIHISKRAHGIPNLIRRGMKVFVLIAT